MFSGNKLLFAITLLIVTMSTSAFGQPNVLEGNCKDLSDEVASTISSPEFASQVLSGNLPVSVIETVFEKAAIDLNESQKYRVRSVFVEFLLRDCLIDPRLTTADEKTRERIGKDQQARSITSVISKLQDGLDFDPELPGWGLVDLPEFDLATITCGSLLGEVQAANEFLREAASKDAESASHPRRYSWFAPWNDVFSIAVKKFRAKFKASGLEEAVKIDTLGNKLPLQCIDDKNSSRTILELLNEEAELLGLSIP